MTNFLIGKRPLFRSLLLAGLVVLGERPAWCVQDIEQPPILYSTSVPCNVVETLRAKLESGDKQLIYDPQLGYLPAVLQELKVPQESQVLAFSKTSLQFRHISPQRPRAIYFNDSIYVGYCRSGEVIEISLADSQLGAVFYTVDQQQSTKSLLTRQTATCLACHCSANTDGVPGHLVRSVYADSVGHLILSRGTTTVDHRTPIEKRWGGWYVTGTHGGLTHLGNTLYDADASNGSLKRDPPSQNVLDQSSGHNVTNLEERFATEHYLTPHSDIVAHLVLEHQVLVHNRLTAANFETRSALNYQMVINRAMKQPLDTPLESVEHRIDSAAEKLVHALLFVDEAPLTAPVAGTTKFAEKFSAQGSRDSQGRSLREFDLRTRMMKYPCSYLITSESFHQLPEIVRQRIWDRLGAVLTSADVSPQFAHLSKSDRRAIQQILRETHPDVPAGW